MAMEPIAVTIHDSSEIAPTCAMFVGSMMMPEPIMFTATMKVSWMRFIRFRSCTTPPATFSAATLMVAPRTCRIRPPLPALHRTGSGSSLPEYPPILFPLRRRSFAHHVGVELDAAVHSFLEDALHFVVEAREAVERLLEGQKVVEHRLGLAVPPLAGNDDADSRRVDQSESRGDAPLDASQRPVTPPVADQTLVSILRRHAQLWKARPPEAPPLQLLDVCLAIESVHLVADLPQGVARVAIAMRRIERRQDLMQVGIAIPQVLELDESRDQCVEFAFVLRRRHQEEDAVQVTLLRHDPLLAQVVRNHCGRHAKVQI